MLPTIRRLAGGALFLLAAGAAAFAWIRRPSETPFLRGRALAEAQGCFACHGAGGLSGSPNPKADSDVPSWSGGTAMMYLEKDQHLREFIQFGNRKDHEDEKVPDLIRMPAYGNSLSENQISDLVAYVKGVSEFYPEMPDSVRPGLEEARKAGCLGCHGPSGRGGVRNPGSFKGLIAGWDDPKISDLARGDKEIEEWIRSGTLKRLENNVVARYFLHHQAVKMPAYDTLLNSDRIHAIIRYIKWL